MLNSAAQRTKAFSLQKWLHLRGNQQVFQQYKIYCQEASLHKEIVDQIQISVLSLHVGWASVFKGFSFIVKPLCYCDAGVFVQRAIAFFFPFLRVTTSVCSCMLQQRT